MNSWKQRTPPWIELRGLDEDVEAGSIPTTADGEAVVVKYTALLLSACLTLLVPLRSAAQHQYPTGPRGCVPNPSSRVPASARWQPSRAQWRSVLNLGSQMAITPTQAMEAVLRCIEETRSPSVQLEIPMASDYGEDASYTTILDYGEFQGRKWISVRSGPADYFVSVYEVNQWGALDAIQDKTWETFMDPLCTGEEGGTEAIPSTIRHNWSRLPVWAHDLFCGFKAAPVKPAGKAGMRALPSCGRRTTIERWTYFRFGRTNYWGSIGVGAHSANLDIYDIERKRFRSISNRFGSNDIPWRPADKWERDKMESASRSTNACEITDSTDFEGWFVCSVVGGEPRCRTPLR